MVDVVLMTSSLLFKRLLLPLAQEVALSISTKVFWSGEKKKRTGRLQQNLETCLLEVMIARESFGKIALLQIRTA
jgi:hypothetical protein